MEVPRYIVAKDSLFELSIFGWIYWPLGYMEVFLKM